MKQKKKHIDKRQNTINIKNNRTASSAAAPYNPMKLVSNDSHVQDLYVQIAK
ncbi:MAG TPA: hypothetical protein VH415_00515 [Nitrososphaeraceae archaeon]|jgi:hypothetical protein